MQSVGKVLVSTLMLLGLLAGGLQSANAQTADDHMNRKEAARYYIDGACALDVAETRFYRAVWKGRKSISEVEISRRLREINRLSTRLGAATLRWSRHLSDPKSAWPDALYNWPERLADNNRRVARMRFNQGYAVDGADWIRYERRIRSEYTFFGAHARLIRQELGLPRQGGC